MIIKCKPVWNFQSLEYEMEIDVNDEKSLNDLFSTYDKILKGLQEISPEQQKVQQVSHKSAAKSTKEPMSTENQQNYLLGLGVPIEESVKMTKKEASAKIKELS